MKTQLTPISDEQKAKFKSDLFARQFIPGELYTKAMQEEFVRLFYGEAEKLRECIENGERDFVISQHNRYIEGKNGIRVYTCDVTSYEDAEQKLLPVMGYKVKTKTAQDYINKGLEIVDKSFADKWKEVVVGCFNIYKHDKTTIYPGDDLDIALNAIKIEQTRGLEDAVASIPADHARAAFIASVCSPNGQELYKQFDVKHQKLMNEVHKFVAEERNARERD